MITTDKLNLNQLKQIELLESLYFIGNAYSLEELIKMNDNNDYKFIIYQIDNNIIGYVILTDLIDYFDIVKIAVNHNNRNNNIGSQLLNQIYNYNKRIVIEVSDRDNTVEFYKKNGFKQIHFREHYYHDNSNAIIMEWNPN